MSNHYLYICFLGFFLLGAHSAIAQNFEQQRKSLMQKQENTRAEIEKLNEQINTYQQRLKETSQKYSALYEQFENLQRLIALQDEKISKLQTEQSQIEDEIALTNRLIKQNQEKLKKLIEEYKETLSYLYKHGQTSELALLFSSSSINQMLIRAYYLKKFNAFREQQAQAIRETEKQLKQDKKRLQQAQQKNEQLLAQIRQEKQKLAKQKQRQQSNVALLRQDKKQLQQKLSEIQQQKERLNNTLTALIEREAKIRAAQRARQRKLAEAKNIEDAETRAREVAKYARSSSSRIMLSDEEMERIETRFARNKGELPWPVNSSTISEHFGRQRHPIYGTVTPNLGIEIVADPASPVRVIQPGYVIGVQPFPGYGDVVMVKHGRFITAYGNLSEVLVRDGTVLQQGDVVGRSGTQYSTKGESVFFLIRENNQNLDPEDWLRNK